MTEEIIHLKYDHKTGEFFKGEILLQGTVKKHRQYYVNGEYFLGHRKAWELFYGEKPKYIYHLDGNKLNNKIDNLYESQTILRETKIKPQDKYLYECWSMIKQRCFNKKNAAYKYYGKRGIKMCKKWRNDFFEFKKYIGHRPTKKHSIDRIDVNGNYEPDNVRWATVCEQANNKRNSLKIKGLTIKELSKKYGVSAHSLEYRIKAGMTFDKIVFKGSLRNRS